MDWMNYSGPLLSGAWVTIKLTIYRGGKTQEFEITLIDEADLSGQTASTQQDSSSNNNGYTNPYGGYGYTIP